MIKLIKKEQIKEVARFIYQLNKDETYYSGFCSGNLSAIESDLEEAVTESNCYCAIENNQLLGVVIKATSPNLDIDIIGPYVKYANLDIAKRLLSKVLKTVKDETIVHFFFSKKSSYYLALMDHFGARFQEIEYIMKCHHYIDSNLEEKGNLVQALEEDKSLVKKMYEDIFIDTYLPSEKVTQKDIYPSVYLYKIENKVVGLAILRERKNTSYLEFFGLHENHRKKGYAKYFLDAILNYSLQKQKHDYVMLVVDQENIAASSLYQKLGFMIEKVNVSYHLTIKKDEN